MDLTKQYIIQAITVASNNLRLSSEKIECVAILRDHISKSGDLQSVILKFKKITELSKFGIRLSEIFNQLSNSKLDFLRLSEQFKEHTHQMVLLLSNLLDRVTPSLLREKLYQESGEDTGGEVDTKESSEKTIELIRSPEKESAIAQKTNELKEEIILADLEKETELSFEQFQQRILKPVKGLENLLSRLISGEFHEDELRSSMELMKINYELSEENGFKVISNMHIIFAVGLKLILNKKMKPDKYIVESLRACLIVIVAVIKSKDVDITNYLNRAERFGEQILKYK